MKTAQKLGLILLSVVGVVFIFWYVYDYMRLQEILSAVVGDNVRYVKKLDSEISTGGPISQETYIFKILDKNRINCSIYGDNQNIHQLLSKLENKYINSKKGYCTKYLIDKYNRTLKVLIQEDIFILRIFVD